MAVFNPPPMPRDEWENLLRFDKEVRRETGGTGIIDIKALMMIRERHMEAQKAKVIESRENGGGRSTDS